MHCENDWAVLDKTLRSVSGSGGAYFYSKTAPKINSERASNAQRLQKFFG
jgi:hypothetical protein